MTEPKKAIVQRLESAERGIDAVNERMDSMEREMNLKFDQLIKMYEERAAKSRYGLPAVSVRESSFGRGGDGSGGGGGGSSSKGVFGLFKFSGASRNAGSSIPTVSVSKSASGENFGDGDGGFSDGDGGFSDGDGGFSGGRGDSKGVFGLFSVAGASINGGSTWKIGSTSKSSSGGYEGGGAGGCFVFSGGGRGLESGGSGLGGRICFSSWNKTLVSTNEELNRDSNKESGPKTLMFTTVSATLSPTDPLVLRRPLVDIVGACLQIGMVESLGKKMQWRECRRREQSSRLMEEDRGKRKATQWDQSAQVAPAAVSYFPP